MTDGHLDKQATCQTRKVFISTENTAQHGKTVISTENTAQPRRIVVIAIEDPPHFALTAEAQ